MEQLSDEEILIIRELIRVNKIRLKANGTLTNKPENTVKDVVAKPKYKSPWFRNPFIQFHPVTQDILNGLNVGQEYDFVCSRNPNGMKGVAYKAENGNIYINFGNIPVHVDWKIKI